MNLSCLKKAFVCFKTTNSSISVLAWKASGFKPKRVKNWNSRTVGHQSKEMPGEMRDVGLKRLTRLSQSCSLLVLLSDDACNPTASSTCQTIRLPGSQRGFAQQFRLQKCL